MTDKFVIQCAGRKTSENSFRAADGRLVKFVANPSFAPYNNDVIYARPDDICENGKSWRELLVEINESGENLEHLSAAYKLYKPKIYQGLVGRFGIENIFILSAGWGLVRADYLLPCYDITFSYDKKRYVTRKKSDLFYDFNQLKASTDDRIFFLGGMSYQSLFADLTRRLSCQKHMFFITEDSPEFLDINPIRYRPKSAKLRTVWHYTLAKDIIEDKLRF